jgi:anti-sigma B factor antagonist
VQFEVNVAPVGAWTVVAVAGEIDVATAPRLRKEAIAIVAEGHHRIVLDLEAVDFLDSTGLGVLIGVLRRISTVGGELRLVCSTPRILDLFTLTGLDRVFDLRASVDDATAGEDAAVPGAGGAA